MAVCNDERCPASVLNDNAIFEKLVRLKKLAEWVNAHPFAEIGRHRRPRRTLLSENRRGCGGPLGPLRGND